MRYRLISGLFLVVLPAWVSAAEPTAKPRDPRDIAPRNPPVISFAGQVADMTRPAFVPAFARVQQQPALQAERDYVQMHSLPVVSVYLGYPFYFSFPTGHYGYRPAHRSVK